MPLDGTATERLKHLRTHLRGLQFSSAERRISTSFTTHASSSKLPAVETFSVATAEADMVREDEVAFHVGPRRKIGET